MSAGAVMHPASRPGPLRVLLWSAAIAVLAVLSSLAGLMDPDVYAQETANWATQARGQDLGNLLAVIVLMVSAWHHRRGSSAAGLVWLGTLIYLVYAFIVYSMAVHLNRLFLVYVAVLGLSAWALLVHAHRVRPTVSVPRDDRVTRVAAGVSVGTGLLFAAMWLGELVPAAITGRAPASLAEAGLWVNPIHVIDLSMVLPAFVVVGVGAWLGRPTPLFWLAPLLAFSVLMGTSIVAAMVLMLGAEGTEVLPPAVVVSLVVVVSAAALVSYLRRVRDTGFRTGEARPPGPTQVEGPVRVG